MKKLQKRKRIIASKLFRNILMHKFSEKCEEQLLLLEVSHTHIYNTRITNKIIKNYVCAKKIKAL